MSFADDPELRADLPAGPRRGDRFLGPTPPPMRVDFGALSHPGKVRKNNEDHYVVARHRRSLGILKTNLPEGGFPPADDEDAYIMAVADGMGGAAAGEVASMLALRTGMEWTLGAIKWTTKVNDQEIRETLERLEEVFYYIDRALIEHAESNPKAVGMGTTLTATYTIGPEAFYVHAGDSRVYLAREGRLRQISRDHTMAQALTDLGETPADLAEIDDLRHVLINCLGGSGDGVIPEVGHFRLADGDRLLLCTDGLVNEVQDEEIARLLALHPDDPDAACRALVGLALDRGGADNITVVLGRYTALADFAHQRIVPRRGEGRGGGGPATLPDQ